MRAAFAKAPFNIEVREIPEPKPKTGEVLVRVGACGVCGTDVHVAEKQAAADFMSLGHEIGGTVVELGSGVDGILVGDRVAVENSSPCGFCEPCENGDPERCESFLHLNDQPGMAEYIAAPARSIVRAGNMEFEEIALAEPLTVALHVTTTAAVPFESDVIVMGPGPIGLMAVKVARRMGARKIFLAGRSYSRARLQLGADLGADEIIEVDKEDLVSAVLRRCPLGVHRAIVTSPPQTLPDVFRLMKYGGIVAFIGIDWGGEQVISFDVNEFHFKKLQLRASHAVPNSFFPMALDMIRRKEIDPQRFVSHRYPLSRVAEAVKTAAFDKENAVKVMVDCLE